MISNTLHTPVYTTHITHSGSIDWNYLPTNWFQAAIRSAHTLLNYNTHQSGLEALCKAVGNYTVITQVVVPYGWIFLRDKIQRRVKNIQQY